MNGVPGLVYVKVTADNNVYYLEVAAENYLGKNLLINKQMIKTGINDIPNLSGLISAIEKKQSVDSFLSDLNEIREAYVQDASSKQTVSETKNSKTSAESQEKHSGRSKADREYLELAKNPKANRAELRQTVEGAALNDPPNLEGRICVLIGAAKDNAGNVYIVRSVINNLTREVEDLDILYASKAKKRTSRAQCARA